MILNSKTGILQNIKTSNYRLLYLWFAMNFVFLFVSRLSYSNTSQSYDNNPTLQFFVVPDSFRNYNNADLFKERLASKNFDPFSKADSLSVLYQTISPAESYWRMILKAEWAAEYKQYDNAIRSFERAAELKPLETIPRKRINEINSKLGRDRINIFFPGIDFEKSSALIQILVLVTIYSIISMIILLVVILFHRNKMEKEAGTRQELKEKYQTLLMDYLFDEEEITEVPAKIDKIAANRFKRHILLEEMKSLIVNLSGDAAEKMRDLYHKMNLSDDSKIKAFSRKWHVKIMGFRELAFMNIKDSNEEIIRCLHSNNSLLRVEAQLALVRLNDNDRFSFLDHLQRPFTKWEQINVHEMIVAHDLEVPDFERWLVSDNRTVVLFSLRMIRVFKQKQAWKKIVSLLYSENQEIRKTSIFVLGELRIKKSVPFLKHHYKYEVYENQLEIVKSLGKISDESTLNFLVIVIDKEEDVQLQIEAAKALRDMGENGEKALEKLMTSDYKNYMIIIKHVLDKRI